MTYYHPTVLSECDSVTWSSVIHSASREVRGEKVVDWDTASLNITALQAGMEKNFNLEKLLKLPYLRLLGKA